jgi:cellulose synthase/poly-beta-1,6-N-acetylglucosamine synthase-like glycosyltransferase
MKLHIVTIVLDGMPTLPALFFNFNALKVDWHWTIIEGAAANTSCTYWCNKQAPRLSEDGTHEFLQMISSHPRVRIVSTVFWPGGKVQMFNHALDQIKEEGVLLQCDADEVWQAWQLDRLVDAFRSDPSIGSVRLPVLSRGEHPVSNSQHVREQAR